MGEAVKTAYQAGKGYDFSSMQILGFIWQHGGDIWDETKQPKAQAEQGRSRHHHAAFWDPRLDLYSVVDLRIHLAHHGQPVRFVLLYHFGLAFGTVLTLGVVPVLYAALFRIKRSG